MNTTGASGSGPTSLKRSTWRILESLNTDTCSYTQYGTAHCAPLLVRRGLGDCRVTATQPNDPVRTALLTRRRREAACDGRWAYAAAVWILARCPRGCPIKTCVMTASADMGSPPKGRVPVRCNCSSLKERT